MFKNKFFKITLTSFISVVCFLGIAFLYFNVNINKNISKADKSNQSVPYKSVPKSCGIMFELPSNEGLLCYLDFEKEGIYVLNIADYNATVPEYYGYSVDYTVEVSDELLEGIVDRVGGIDINNDNNVMRYTGVQVVDLLKKEYNADVKKQVIEQIFSKIAENGFSANDFIFIIENTKSNLIFTECIYWLDFIEKMSKNVAFIN